MFSHAARRPKFVWRFHLLRELASPLSCGPARILSSRAPCQCWTPDARNDSPSVSKPSDLVENRQLLTLSPQGTSLSLNAQSA